MSFSHGLNSEVRIGDPTVLRDISTSTKNVGMDLSKDTVETTALKSKSKTYIPGLKDSTFSMEGSRDEAHEDWLWGAYQDDSPAGVPLEYYPEGNLPGKRKYTCHVHVTGFNESSSTDDTVGWTAEVQVTGDVAREVIS